MVGTSVLVTVAGGLLLAFEHAVAVDALVLVPIGLLLLTDLPVILELSERRAGDSAGTVTALLWLAGNGTGRLVRTRFAVQLLVHHPTSRLPGPGRRQPVCRPARGGALARGRGPRQQRRWSPPAS